MKKLSAIVVFLSVLLSSCDCYVRMEGKVLSSKTRSPLTNASIELIGRDVKSLTDENGTFNIREHTGYCYPVELEVKFEKFKPFRIIIENESDWRHYKVKSKSEFIEFDTPFYPNPQNKGTSANGTWIDKYSENFEIKSDSIIILLDEDNLEKEIKANQDKLKENYG